MKLTKRRFLGLATAGLVLAPVLASSVVSAANTTISSQVAGTISEFTTSATVAIDVSSASGVKQTVNTDAVTVSTNNSTGYTLKLEDANNSDALCTSQGAGCSGIPATAGTFASPAIMNGANQWGYHIDAGAADKWCDSGSTCGDTFGTVLSPSATASTTLKFAKVPVAASPDTLKTTGSTASSDVTYVWYGVNVDPTQASGIYTDVVTYTATANN